LWYRQWLDQLILTKIFEDKLSYKQALMQAQQAGFAESQPLAGCEGIDAVNKLTILLLHAYGIVSSPGNLLHKGITQIHSFDSEYAREKRV
jgi:homoserine dehydrogenase